MPKLRVAVLAVVLLPAALGVATSGCGPEEEPSFGDPSGIAGKRVPGSSGGTDTPAGDGGASGDGGAVSTDPFTPEPPEPTKTAKSVHTAKGAVVTEKSACLTCHRAGGEAAAFPWAMGGVVHKAGAPVAGATVVAVGSFGRVAAKSDAEGYFWVPLTGAAVNDGTAYARFGTTGKQMVMVTKLATGDGDCNKCHGTPTAPTVYVQ